MISSKSLIAALALSVAATAAPARVLGIATNPQGSFGYAVGTAVAQVMEKDAHLTTRVEPMSGSSAYTALVNRGQVEFALLNSLDVVSAYNGQRNFAGHKNRNIRLVAVMFPIRVGLGVPNDSPVHSISQLKGLRIPSQFTAQNAVKVVQDAELATGGLTMADMKPVPVANDFKAMRLLGEGRVDVAHVCFGCAAARELNVALKSHGGLRFLSFSDSPKALAAMHKAFPGSYLESFHPPSAIPGIVGPTRLMVFSDFLLVNAHVPKSIVYKVVKALHGHKAQLAATSALMKRFDPNGMAQASSVPYHPGAVEFYKQIGQWPPKQR